jgi:hypothetical protein
MDTKHCYDIVHAKIILHHPYINHAGDVFLILLLSSTLWLIWESKHYASSLQIISKTAKRLMACIIIRTICYCLTSCNMNIVRTARPWSDITEHDAQGWFIISGHLYWSLLWWHNNQQLNRNSPRKWILHLQTCCVIGIGIFQIITLEHHTVDIFITSVLVYMMIHSHLF